MPIYPDLLSLRPRDCCPLCGDREYDTHMPLGALAIARCRTCRFMFSNATMDEQAMVRFYAESYGGLRHRLGQQVNARVNLRAVRRLLQLEPGDRVLEVGSGYGFLLRALVESRRIVPIGVELSKEEADYSRQINRIDTVDVPLVRSGLPFESFDLVACFETIEHVPSPLTFIRELSQYVRPGGALLIMTDNFESKAATRMGASFPKWIPHQHVCHFTPETLPRAISSDRSLRIDRFLSYTPWELAARSLVATAGGADVKNGFDLERELATEMKRSYRLFGVRRLLNQLWARWTFREDLDGALMYVLARKNADPITASTAV